MLMLQTQPQTAPYLPLPGMTVYPNSTALPSTAVAVGGTAAAVSAEASSAPRAEHQAGSEELPLWVETKTAEGKVGLRSSLSNEFSK